MADFATEAGHWYQPDGTPLYEVPTAKGDKLRPTTLRDARKLGLYPSVTGIMKELAAPGLTVWKAKEAAKAAFYLSLQPNETLDQYAMRAIKVVEDEVAKGAEEGSRIHAALEQFFMGQPYASDYWPIVESVDAYLETISDIDMWSTERSFARHGFGGKVDLHQPGIVVDFKTKDFDESNLPKTYENHALQLGAYREGLQLGDDAYGVIIFISRTVRGLIHPLVLPPEELTKGYQMFGCLFNLWCIRRNYFPWESK